MKIKIENLKSNVIIGILQIEREITQNIKVNLYLEYNYKNIYMDYMQLVEFIKRDLIVSKYKIIEDALITINKKIRESFSTIDIKSIYISITKIDISSDCNITVENIFKSNYESINN